MLVSALEVAHLQVEQVELKLQTFPYKAFGCYVALRCSDTTWT